MLESLKKKRQKLRLKHARHVRDTKGLRYAIEYLSRRRKDHKFESHLELYADDLDFKTIEEFVITSSVNFPSISIRTIIQNSVGYQLSSEFDLQVLISQLIRANKKSDAAKLMLGSAFLRAEDNWTLALKVGNTRQLAEKLDSTFIQWMAKLESSLSSGENELDRTKKQKKRAIRHLTWSRFLIEAVANSVYLRIANNLKKHPSWMLAIYRRRILVTQVRNDGILNDYFKLSIQHDCIAACDNVVKHIISEANRYNQLRIPALLKVIPIVRTLDDLERITLYTEIIPLLHVTLVGPSIPVSATTKETESSRSSESRKLPKGPIVVQEKIDALIQQNMYDEALLWLKQSLFDGNLTASVVMRRFGNIINLTKVLRRPDQILDAYINSDIFKTQHQLHASFWKMRFSQNTYYVVSKQTEKSRELLDATRIDEVPQRFAKLLFLWMSMHQPAKVVSDFYKKWHSLTNSDDQVTVIYATALHANNQFDSAISLLANIPLLAAALQRSVSLNILGRSEEAFDSLVPYLETDRDHAGLWMRLASVCTATKTDELERIWSKYSSMLSSQLRDQLQFSLATTLPNIEIDWARSLRKLEDAYDDKLAVEFMRLAFARNEHSAFRLGFSIFLKHVPGGGKFFATGVISQISRLLYRNNELDLGRLYHDQLCFDNSVPSTEMDKQFCLGNIIEALEARSEFVLESIGAVFRREGYKPKQCDSYVITPERHLAGELYNSFFFLAMLEESRSFSVVCDLRLQSIFERTFPTIDFIPKIPRRMMNENPSAFSNSSFRITEYLDDASVEHCKSRTFIRVPVEKSYAKAVELGNRSSGWLNPDVGLRQYWRDLLKSKFGGDKILVGFSSSSTQRSAIRDHQIVSLDAWEEIFRIPNVVFINLNPGLGDREAEELGKKYDVPCFNPNFDLFNDFENLLALMSELDCAILPANSLMDFASSVGLRTYVFSPSGMMSNWTTREADSYVFSEKVEFVYGDTNSGRTELVKQLSVRVMDHFGIPIPEQKFRPQ